MRRDEFNITDKSELEKLLKNASYGIFCLNDEKFPYMAPVNFVYYGDGIYFHGASNGRKYELSLKNSYASFSVLKEYSFIPSYFGNSDIVCSANQFFVSAFLEGQISFVKDMDKKIDILEALIKKYQSEGKYLNIKENVEKYTSSLSKTSVFKFDISFWSLKIKAGQNMKITQLENVKQCLKERGKKEDLETIELIERFFKRT